MNAEKIVLASPYSRHDLIEEQLRATGLEVVRLRAPVDISAAALRAVDPSYVFFPHWSWKIPPDVFESFECVIFHMTDLPYGRGGSPLQNLIVRGHQETALTALRCVADLDAGPVFLKRPLSLFGSAEEIFLRAAEQMAQMILEIVEKKPVPKPQSGEIITFKRRTRHDGDIAGLDSLARIHDWIRMLDADGYPSAYLEIGEWCFEFTRSSYRGDHVLADVRIARRKNGS